MNLLELSFSTVTCWHFTSNNSHNISGLCPLHDSSHSSPSVIQMIPNVTCWQESPWVKNYWVETVKCEPLLVLFKEEMKCTRSTITMDQDPTLHVPVVMTGVEDMNRKRWRSILTQEYLSCGVYSPTRLA